MVIHGLAGGRPVRVTDLYFGPMMKRFQLSIAVLFWPVVLAVGADESSAGERRGAPRTRQRERRQRPRRQDHVERDHRAARRAHRDALARLRRRRASRHSISKGKYVLPGLIDAHTHADDFAAFRRALESGVTTVRSAGVSNYVDVGFHAAREERDVPRPGRRDGGLSRAAADGAGGVSRRSGVRRPADRRHDDRADCGAPCS